MDNTPGRMSEPDRPSGEDIGKTAEASNLPDATTRRTEAIRAEIEQTRDDMAETIDAIQDRLRPSALVANATGQLRAAATEKVKAMTGTAGHAADEMMSRTRDTAGGVLDMIKDNPIPAAMIGAGAVWLMMGKRNGSGTSAEANPGVWRQSAGDSSGYPSTRSYEEPNEQGLQERAREYANDTSAAVRRTGRQVQQRFGRTLMENPLLVGAGALLLGAAFGMAVPETERENEWMGEARDSVVDRAQKLAGDATSTLQEKARDVAAVAGQAVESMAPQV